MFADITILKASPTLTYQVPAHLLNEIDIGKPVDVPLRRQTVTGYISDIYSERRDGKSFTIREIKALSDTLPKLDENYLELLKWVANYYHYPLGEVIRTALPSQRAPKKITAYRLTKKGRALNEEKRTAFAKRSGKRLSLIKLLESKDVILTIPSDFKSAYSWLKKNEYVASFKQKQELSEAVTTTADAISSHDPHSLDPPHNLYCKLKVISLNEDQERAYSSLINFINANEFRSMVLHGITGSGKTEVYLAAARHCLVNNKSVLILVPEIALTPQLLQRVQDRLGVSVCVLHSGLTDHERYRQWALINEGKASVVIGARSSVFAPLKNLGLVVVDEEHECSFKQEDRLRYNARDLAILLAKLNKATVLLGSATPSIESYYQISTGKAKLEEIHSQFHSNHRPKVELVDMRRESKGTTISNLLARRIQDTLDASKQSILFLNRRGFASWLNCDSCGHVPQCPNCSVSLTYYEYKNMIRCHYCGHSAQAPTVCEECGQDNFRHGAIGTEAVEKELNKQFPTSRVARIDRDTISKKGELESILKKVRDNEVNIIVGTQMIAKGHDFPHVQLAAVLNADDSLNIPDFRAGERTFQLLTQVSGRAGRRGEQGTAIIQTFDPDNPYIQFASTLDYTSYVRFELEFRKEHRYPPFSRLARVLISAANADEGRIHAERIARHISQINAAKLEVLGPAPAVLQKLQNRFRWNILLKGNSAAELNALLRSANRVWRQNIPNSIGLSIDIDPSSLL